MQALNRQLLNFYIIFSTFMTWLAITGWLRFPVMLLLISFAITLPLLIYNLIKRPLEIIISQEDWLLIAFLPIALVSFFFGSQSSRSFNHLMSFGFVFIIYNIFYKYAIRLNKFSIKHIFKIITIAAVFANSIVIIEWIFVNIFDIVIRNYFLFDEKTSNMVYYKQSFFRSVPGTCEEPSLMAFNMNIIFPLGLYYIHNELPKFKIAYILLYVVALVFTASSGGVGFIILAYIISELLDARAITIVRLIATIIGAIIVSYVIYFFLPEGMQHSLDKLLENIIGKVTFNAASANMRTTAWKFAIRDWLQTPWIGKGPGYGNEGYFGFGYQSGFLKILAEIGIFAFIFFSAFLYVIFKKIIAIRKPIRQYLLVSFFTGVPYLLIADGYYHICLWLLITLVQLIHFQSEESDRKEIKVN